jgi:cytochrome c-type biogenesis protein CcmH/NrfF
VENGYMKGLLFALALVATPLSAQFGTAANYANVQLSDPVKEERAVALMENLRCIQCQGQSIHDSDAPIAGAMRHEVRSRIVAGQSDQQITDWLVERYGDWVSYSPPTYGAGLALWLAPLLLLLIALGIASRRFGNSDT